MSILASDILTFVNAKLKRSETDINDEIQTVLDELSEENCLQGEDTTQTLSSGSTTLNHPTNYMELIAITLNDGSTWGEPLKPVPGGMNEYRRLMREHGSSDYGEPEYYAEFNGKFYLYPTADGAYTTKIEFYKYHGQVESFSEEDAILFGDEFTRVIKFGATYEVACRFGLSRYIEIWGPRYYAALKKITDNIPMKPYITRDT